MAKQQTGRHAARYAAVFLVMMSNLMLELLFTRIFSATMWYHFAFMAVSIALFGTTAGAVVVFVWPHRFPAERTRSLAARGARLCGVDRRLYEPPTTDAADFRRQLG